MPDPIEMFLGLYEQATRSCPEPDAMVLSTVDADGRPSGRYVLLKGVDDRGLVFFTNYDSRKGHDLAAHPHAALVLFWEPLHRQIRVEGAIGELKRVFGARSLPYPHAVRPNQMVTFRHPANGRNITVPLRLPDGPPRLLHGTNRITYNYGDYTVEARFLPDGAVDVIYNSGLGRPLSFD